MARWRASSRVPWLAWVAGRELVHVRNVAEAELTERELAAIDVALGVLLRLTVTDRPAKP